MLPAERNGNEMTLVGLFYSLGGYGRLANRTAPLKEENNNTNQRNGMSFFFFISIWEWRMNDQIEKWNKEMWLKNWRESELSAAEAWAICEMKSIYWWNGAKSGPQRKKRAGHQAAQCCAASEQTTQQPLIAAGRGKPAINWWLVCFSSFHSQLGLPAAPRPCSTTNQPSLSFHSHEMKVGWWLLRCTHTALASHALACLFFSLGAQPKEKRKRTPAKNTEIKVKDCWLLKELMNGWWKRVVGWVCWSQNL